jgi:hypothetical protein
MTTVLAASIFCQKAAMFCLSWRATR